MNLTDLERGDNVHVTHDHAPRWPKTYEVRDIEVEDIGLAEVVVVALSAGCSRYTMHRVGENEPVLRDDEGYEIGLGDASIDTFESASELSYD